MIHGDIILVRDVGSKDRIGELGASIRANMLWWSVCLNDILHRMSDFCSTLAFQSPSHQVFRISIHAYKDIFVSTILVESCGLLTAQHFLYPFVLFGREIDVIDEVYVSLEPTDDHSSGASSFCWLA